MKEISAILDELLPEKNPKYKLTDIGNAALFAEIVKDRLRFVPERKKWYFFNGQRWVQDTDNHAHAMEVCKAIADALLKYAGRADFLDESDKSKYVNQVNRWNKLNVRENILKDSATIRSIWCHISDFDRNPYLFNCLNGTIDLEHDEFREHKSEDMITMISGVEWNENIDSPRWRQFIDEITCNDSELAEYIQKKAGYYLTGTTSEENLDIFYGPTSRNGKGTFCETFVRMMGDYGCTASPETIAARKNPDSRTASGDLARLAGKRFINVSEPDKNMLINPSLVKSLTGNDTITARRLYESEFEFQMEGKFVINTNHLPNIDDRTLFESDRIKVIPFRKHFKESERDPHLKKTLVESQNLSGIFNWCLEGWLKYKKDGLKDPPAVREATEEYRETFDRVGQFVKEMLAKDQESEVNAIEVHDIYRKWCSDNHYESERFAVFKKSLASVGITVRRTRPKGSGSTDNKVQMIHGYRLQESQE